MMVLNKDLMVIDCGPLELMGLIHMNKKVGQFYMIGNLAELKKLKRISQLKSTLLLVCLLLDYRPLKESCFIITTAGTIVAIKKDQNNRELDRIVGNKSYGSNIPTKIHLEKSGLGKNNSPKNKPINIDRTALLSLIFF